MLNDALADDLAALLEFLLEGSSRQNREVPLLF